VTLGLAQAAAAAATVRDLPVSFRVQDTNRTPIPCSSDGLSYTIRGHLTGPPAGLAGNSAPTVTFYLHDFSEGEWFWRFDAVPGYNFAAEMASAGQTSLTVSGLGYLPSDRPDPGTAPCVGSEADIAHQIVADLRAGNYAVDGPGGSGASAQRPVKFDRVIVAGQSVGAQIAQIEAYTFADVAGLAEFGWSDQGASDYTIEQAFTTNQICAMGGQQADGTSGPHGYAYFEQTDSGFKSGFFNQSNAAPAVIAATVPLHARGPCGDIESVTPAIFVDANNLSKITVPVLLIYGGADVAYPPSGAQSQAQSFTGSSDVSTEVIDKSGHAFTLERTAGAFIGAVSHWLDKRWGALTPPPQAHQTAALRAVRDARLAVGPNGTIKVSLFCSAPTATACKGVIKLRISSRAYAGIRPGRLIATGSFSIAANRTARVRMRLNRAAVRALQGRGKLAARLTGSGRTSDGARLFCLTHTALVHDHEGRRDR
jgi:pimeloyl-ACP methyl ester carboxylesterase